MRALLLLTFATAPLFAQSPTINSILNAGSLDARFSPGVLATINGSNLGSDLTTGTTVNIGGFPAPVTAVSPSQLTFEIPFGIYLGPSTVTVTVPNQGMAFYSVNLVDYAPAFLTQAGSPALALFFHADNSLVTQMSPARRGETISGQFTGLGKLNRDAPDGVTPTSPMYSTLVPPSFTLAGESAPVTQSFLVPGLVGVFRVDVQVPNDAPPGLQAAILTINGIASNTGTLPIAGAPAVQIEAPASGSTVSGVITVSGWALDNLQSIGSAISSVKIQVDGVTLGTASYGIPRPEICTIYPGRSGCPNVGFTLPINTQSLSPGSHTITAVVTNSDPVPASSTASTTVTVGSSPSLFIDSPTPGATLSGVVNVTGWAVDNSSPFSNGIGSVLILVDGATLGAANYGISRPEACNPFPGRPNCPNVGFSYQLNTGIFGVGSHTLSAVAVDTNKNILPGSWTVNFVIGPAPSVNIDTPVAGANVSGTISVTGWALDSTAGIGTAITAVQVYVDGARVGTATTIPRADVCDVYPGRPGCPNVGFSFSLNTASLSSGTHMITVTATDSDFTPDTGSASVTVNVQSSVGISIESPSNGSTVSGSVLIGGWAMAPQGTNMASINVAVDGLVNGSATYGINRPDICNTNPGPNCPNVGFSYTLNTSGLSSGPHLVTVNAVNNEATPKTNSASLTINVSSGPLTVFIDSPAVGATVSGTVPVSGWAVPNSGGTPISLVEIFVDEVYFGLAGYGTARPEICAVYANRSGCPNVGYTFNLDTSQLAAGSHSLRVMAVDSSGPPNLSSSSTTFNLTK